MKLSSQSISLILALGFVYNQNDRLLIEASSESQNANGNGNRLLERCCQVGTERAIESQRFNCKLSAREALIGGSNNNINSQLPNSRQRILALAAEATLARDSNFADQCEMILESCCLAHHRTRNCNSGKQFAKSGSACMDVELSKEASIATESFNDCCMSCSLGILAAKTQPTNHHNQNETTLPISSRCKLISPLASSLSGQLYEQTYAECCLENLPRQLSALREPGAPIDCNSQTNPCAQRCISSAHLTSHRLHQTDRCECFSGYKLAADGFNCVDVDECKLDQHTCNRASEICENTVGGFRCLARQATITASRTLFGGSDLEDPNHLSELTSGNVEFASLRLCPFGLRWNSDENRCRQIEGQQQQRNARLF